MARVCTDTLINEKNPDRNGFYMEDILKDNLDLLLKNITKDWDFVIIIAGNGRVRVGKSVLALQIAYYWKDMIKKKYNIDVPFNVKDNIVFNGEELIKKGNELGAKYHYSPLIFDEAGADLEGVKVMRTTTQNVKDFLRECGQYNLLTILVLPDYFDLPRSVALSRSDCLINVFPLASKDGLIERGFFNFYSRESKKKLFLYGKKELNYSAYKYDFHGRFYNNYPVNEEEYRQAKVEALKSREETKKKDKYNYQRDVLLTILNDKGFNTAEISRLLSNWGISITQQGVSAAITNTRQQKYNKIMYNEDDFSDDGDESERKDSSFPKVNGSNYN